MELKTTANSRKRLLLFLIPLYTIIFSGIFLKKFSPFYMSEPDPCYCYLLNGTNLASGHMEVGHIDHPGTTTQCFASVVIFAKHLLSSSHLPILQDVISNPESYLYTCSIALILLLVSINYLTGSYVFKRTGNIGLSILFQMTPLINTNIIQRGIMLEPESAIIIVATFFMAYLFLNAPENNMQADKPLTNKTIILFGVFSSFLIATKYTCAPVICLVLFILQKTKNRFIYLGATILSFLTFIIPALPKIKNMFQWVWGLATHDGIYGTGEERLINSSQFFHNFKGILLTDAVFTSIYSIITLTFIVAIINRIIKKQTVPFFRTICGLWLSITLLILAVAKHTEFHYLIFAECCFPLGMAVSYKILSNSFVPFVESYRKYEKRILYSFLSIFSVFLVIEKVRYIPLHYPKNLGINKYIDNHKTTSLIISCKSGLACERKEPALYLGYMYAGNIQDEYARALDTLYPNTYIYWNGSQTLTHWNETLPIADFLNKNKSVLIYLKGYDDTAQVNIIHKFSSGNAVQKSELFKDSETLQSVCLIKTQ